MIPGLILSLIFFAGFLAGYGVRAWRSHKRRAHYLRQKTHRQLFTEVKITDISAG